MKFLSLLCSLCIFSLCQAQDWDSIDIGTQEDLNKIYFLDDNKGFIIGNNGVVFETLDGGESWTNIAVGASHDLLTISFVDQNIGFINGLKTTDGGASWSIQAATEQFGLIKGFDADHLIGGDGLYFHGEVYKSSDGGANWQTVGDPIETGFYTDEYFINDSIGYMTAWYSGHLIKTVDGGENWTEVNSIAQITGFSGIYGISFPSLDIGVVASNAHITKTIDGGATWFSIYSISDNTPLFNTRSIFTLSDNNYIVVGGSFSNSVATIYETKDGGATWTLSNNSLDMLEDLSCTSSNCFAVGQNGTVLKRKNTTVSNNASLPFLKKINLYPNPTSDYLRIDAGEQDIEWIEIIDLQGKVHKQISLAKKNVFVGDLPKGFYLLKIKFDKEESLIKFEKL